MEKWIELLQYRHLLPTSTTSYLHLCRQQI
jgi:hypothetical protein